MITASKATLQALGHSSQKTVSVKIRIHKDLRQTIDFVNTVQAAGVDFITIHGRTRSTPSSIPVDLSSIKLVADHISVPKLCNGDIFTLADAAEFVEKTRVDGVMAARGLLQNPALFSGYESCPWEAVEVFMNKVVRAPIPYKLVVHHLSEMCGSDRSQCGEKLLSKEERKLMMECGSMIELMEFLDEVKGIRRLGDV